MTLSKQRQSSKNIKTTLASTCQIFENWPNSKMQQKTWYLEISKKTEKISNELKQKKKSSEIKSNDCLQSLELIFLLFIRQSQENDNFKQNTKNQLIFTNNSDFSNETKLLNNYKNKQKTKGQNTSFQQWKIASSIFLIKKACKSALCMMIQPPNKNTEEGLVFPHLSTFKNNLGMTSWWPELLIMIEICILTQIS